MLVGTRQCSSVILDSECVFTFQLITFVFNALNYNNLSIYVIFYNNRINIYVCIYDLSWSINCMYKHSAITYLMPTNLQLYCDLLIVLFQVPSIQVFHTMSTCDLLIFWQTQSLLFLNVRLGRLASFLASNLDILLTLNVGTQVQEQFPMHKN